MKKKNNSSSLRSVFLRSIFFFFFLVQLFLYIVFIWQLVNTVCFNMLACVWTFKPCVLQLEPVRLCLRWLVYDIWLCFFSQYFSPKGLHIYTLNSTVSVTCPWLLGCVLCITTYKLDIHFAFLPMPKIMKVWPMV